MYQICTRVLRFPNGIQCLQQISRTYCYKASGAYTYFFSQFQIFENIFHWHFKIYCVSKMDFCFFVFVDREMFETIKKLISRKEVIKNKVKTPANNIKFGKPRPALDNGRSLKIVQALPSDPEEFNEEILIDFFNELSLAPISDDALLHENCMTLIDASRLILPKLCYSQVVNIFNQISRAEIPMFDEITKTVVDALINRHSEANIHEIVDIDFSLRRYHAKHRISRLFENLNETVKFHFVTKKLNEIEQCVNYSELSRIIRYLSNNQSVAEIVNKSILSRQLLSRPDYEFKLNDAVCVIVLYTRFPEFDEYSKSLLSKIYRIWCNLAKTVEDANSILMLLSVTRFINCDFELIHDTLLIKHCVKLASNKNDFSSAFTVQQRFNELVGFN